MKGHNVKRGRAIALCCVVLMVAACGGSKGQSGAATPDVRAAALAVLEPLAKEAQATIEPAGGGEKAATFSINATRSSGVDCVAGWGNMADYIVSYGYAQYGDDSYSIDANGCAVLDRAMGSFQSAGCDIDTDFGSAYSMWQSATNALSQCQGTYGMNWQTQCVQEYQAYEMFGYRAAKAAHVSIWLDRCTGGQGQAASGQNGSSSGYGSSSVDGRGDIDCTGDWLALMTSLINSGSAQGITQSGWVIDFGFSGDAAGCQLLSRTAAQLRGAGCSLAADTDRLEAIRRSEESAYRKCKNLWPDNWDVYCRSAFMKSLTAGKNWQALSRMGQWLEQCNR